MTTLAHKEFLTVRYLLVPSDTVWQSQRTKQENNQSLVDEFMVNQEFSAGRGVSMAIWGVEYHPEQRAYLAKLAKKKTIKRQDKTENDIEDTKEPSWPFAYMIVYPAEQIVLIERKSELKLPIDRICAILDRLLNSKIQYKGLVVSFKTINRKNAFWNMVEKADGVSYLKFQLNSPNMFGSRQEATDTLRAIKELHNNTKTGYELINEDAALKLPREEIDPLVEYANEGGGTWIMTLQKGDRRQTKKSSDTVITTTGTIDDDDDETAVLFDIMHRALAKIQKYEDQS